MTLGSLAMTPEPLQGASSSTLSMVLPPSTCQGTHALLERELEGEFSTTLLVLGLQACILMHC